MRFSHGIKRQLGSLLLSERQKRHLSGSYVARKINISLSLLDDFEDGCGGHPWKHYGELLDFYNKDIKIELVDRSEDQENPTDL